MKVLTILKYVPGTREVPISILKVRTDKDQELEIKLSSEADRELREKLHAAPSQEGA